MVRTTVNNLYFLFLVSGYRPAESWKIDSGRMPTFVEGHFWQSERTRWYGGDRVRPRTLMIANRGRTFLYLRWPLIFLVHSSPCVLSMLHGLLIHAATRCYTVCLPSSVVVKSEDVRGRAITRKDAERTGYSDLLLNSQRWKRISHP
jgi:hypothetical protein